MLLPCTEHKLERLRPPPLYRTQTWRVNCHIRPAPSLSGTQTGRINCHIRPHSFSVQNTQVVQGMQPRKKVLRIKSIEDCGVLVSEVSGKILDNKLKIMHNHMVLRVFSGVKNKTKTCLLERLCSHHPLHPTQFIHYPLACVTLEL